MSPVHPGLSQVHALPDWEELAPKSFYARRVRPAFCLASALGLLASALIPGIAIALINWAAFRDPRRILFVQDRVGYRGGIFRIYKFRTMSDPKEGAHASWEQGQDVQRVTRFGRFLRSTHLDELPQLINILKGDMALIGPRPEMVEIEAWARGVVPGFEQRLAIHPGITGQAQIMQGYTGKDVEAYAEKFALNQGYLAAISFTTDLSILARTVAWVLRGRGWSWKGKGRPAAEEGEQAERMVA